MSLLAPRTMSEAEKTLFIEKSNVEVTSLCRIGRFEVLSHLARGSRSNIYKVRDSDGTIRAMKLLRHKYVTDRNTLLHFYDTAKSAIRTDIDGFLQTHEVGEEGGNHFAVMDYHRCHTLDDHIARFGPFDEEKALQIVSEIGLALNEYHRMGMIHGRLHPGNILLDKNEVPYIKGHSSSPEIVSSKAFTSNKRLRNHFAYYSPEQIHYNTALTAKSDIYALAAIFYFLLTSRAPFRPQSANRMLREKRLHAFTSPDEFTSNLSQRSVNAIRMGMYADPEKRPETIGGGIDDDSEGNRIGGYLLAEFLGSGNNAEVYRALSPDDDVVAVKILKQDKSNSEKRLLRFYQEAKLAMRVSHENLVKSIEVGQDDGRHFCAMEYVDGDNLAWLLKKNGPFAERKALKIIIEVASGLQSAHKFGLIHRDVKPSNVMITQDGVAKLTDLGLAKDLENDLFLTEDGRGLGTPQYIAPEQFRDAKSATKQFDVYGLGTTLYVMVTGRLPFTTDSLIDTIRAKMDEDYIDPCLLNPELTPEISELIRKALCANPKRRYQTVTQFMSDAVDCLCGKRLSHQDSDIETSNRNAFDSVDDVESGVAWSVLWLDESGETQKLKGSIRDIERLMEIKRIPKHARIKGPGQTAYVAIEEMIPFAEETQKKSSRSFGNLAKSCRVLLRKAYLLVTGRKSR